MFEATLFRDGNGGRRSRRTASLSTAIALHAVGLLSVMGASIWFTEEPPDPDIPIVYQPPAGPTDLPGATPGRKPAAPRLARLAPPRLLPAEPQPGPVEETATPATPGNEDGIDGWTAAEGLSEGPPGGTGTRPRTGFSETPPRPVGDIRAPELVRRVGGPPLYPETARRARVEGLVVLEAIISVAGQIEDLRIVKSAGALLDSAAEEAVRGWKYRPATLNGRAVRVLLTVTVSFRLG